MTWPWRSRKIRIVRYPYRGYCPANVLIAGRTEASSAISRDTYPSVDRATESKAHARRPDRPRPWAYLQWRDRHAYQLERHEHRGTCSECCRDRPGSGHSGWVNGCDGHVHGARAEHYQRFTDVRGGR